MKLVPELIIGPSELRPRTLRINWSAERVTVSTYGKSGFGNRFNIAIAQPSQMRLSLVYERQLWAGSTCFDLSEDEVPQVRTVLEPLGLLVETSYSPPSVTPSLATDHEATVAVNHRSPSNGNSGTRLPGSGSPGGALDDESVTFAKALTSGEVY